MVIDAHVQQIVLSALSAVYVSFFVAAIWVADYEPRRGGSGNGSSSSGDAAATSEPKAALLDVAWHERPFPWQLRRVGVAVSLLLQAMAVDVVGGLGVYSPDGYSLLGWATQSAQLVGGALWVHSTLRLLYRQLHASVPLVFPRALAVITVSYTLAGLTVYGMVCAAPDRWPALQPAGLFMSTAMALLIPTVMTAAYVAVRRAFQRFIDSVRGAGDLTGGGNGAAPSDAVAVNLPNRPAATVAADAPVRPHAAAAATTGWAAPATVTGPDAAATTSPIDTAAGATGGGGGTGDADAGISGGSRTGGGIDTGYLTDALNRFRLQILLISAGLGVVAVAMLNAAVQRLRDIRSGHVASTTREPLTDLPRVLSSYILWVLWLTAVWIACPPYKLWRKRIGGDLCGRCLPATSSVTRR